MDDITEIQNVLGNIQTAFSGLDFLGWLACFHSPRMIVFADGPFVSTGETDCKEVMGPIFETMRALGLKRTQLDTCNIKLLSNTHAMVSTVWSRFLDNDKLLEQIGATYLFLKKDDQWRIAMVTGHSAKVVVIED